MTFTNRKLRSLEKCATGILRCIQTVPEDTERAACVAKGAARCSREIDKVAVEEAKRRSVVAATCGSPPLTGTDLTEQAGLGYGAIIPSCEPPVESASDVARCVLAGSGCEADRVFGAQQPRARDLMQFAQVPAERLATLSCLPSRGGQGEDLDLETTTGRAVTRCTATITRTASALANSTLQTLGRCHNKVFRCEQSKRFDERCLATARALCENGLRRIEAKRTSLGPGIDKACGASALAFDALSSPHGAFLSALAGECADLGVTDLAGLDDYRTCLVRQHHCRVAALLRLATPRGAALLSSLGLDPSRAFPPGLCDPPDL